MRHISARMMVGFTSELQKTAGISGFLAKQLGGRFGRQMALGAGVGAVGGAAADKENRLRGALKGGLLGGAAGTAGVLAQKAGREWAGTGIKNFGRRQLHSVTGRGVKDVGEARKIGLIPKKEYVAEGPVRSYKANMKAKDMDKLHEEAFDKGYTSVPGVLHGLVTKPGDVLKSGWQRGGTMGKAFAGLGAYGAAKGAIKKPEPDGPGRAENVLRGAGSTLGWIAAPHAMLGGSLIGEGLGAAAGKAGKVLDKRVKAGRDQVRASRAGYLRGAGNVYR